MTAADDDNNNLPPEDNNPPTMPEGDGGQNQSFSFDEPIMDDPEEQALNRRGSSLGGNSSKAIAFGAALVLGTGIILYYLFPIRPRRRQ